MILMKKIPDLNIITHLWIFDTIVSYFDSNFIICNTEFGYFYLSIKIGLSIESAQKFFIASSPMHGIK